MVNLIVSKLQQSLDGIARHDKADFDIGETEGVITLHNISVDRPYQGQGIGTRIMQDICDVADEYDSIIELEVGGTGNDFDLVAWYSRYDFKWADDGDYMTRQPNIE